MIECTNKIFVPVLLFFFFSCLIVLASQTFRYECETVDVANFESNTPGRSCSCAAILTCAIVVVVVYPPRSNDSLLPPRMRPSDDRLGQGSEWSGSKIVFVPGPKRAGRKVQPWG